MRKLQSIDPSNYQVLGKVGISSEEEVAKKVQIACIRQREWADLGIANRVAILRNVVTEFMERKREMAILESHEMGMPINEALADIDGTVGFANWYLDNAERILSPETTFENDLEINQVYHEPIGVMAAILPWNYPFLLFVWDTFPGLIAGNAVVMKHSEETPLCGKLIEEMMIKHLPDGVFSEVYGDGQVGLALAREDIDILAFTGSTKTGKRIYRELAQKDKFVRTVMELGGSAPGIVFEDADLDLVTRSVCEFRLSNCGQYCDGLKRLIVHESVFNEVADRIATAFSERKIGAAEEETTQLGPLAAKRQLDLLAEQVLDARAKGATTIVGGYSLEPELGGAFFKPAVLTHISGDMKVWAEEVFGPVLPVVAFSTERDAIRIANWTNYGLGSYVYTADLDRAQRVARSIQTGMVSINGANYTTPFNPFGGWKHSGIGRQHGKWGFYDVTQPKTVARPK